jgi:hypothetical protein
MGGTTYNYASRSTRATSLGYTTVSVQNIEKVFVQKAKGTAHESMKSQGITIREARDSDVHPNTFPVIIGLDMTGSMHDIPVMLIKDGLPKLVSQIIQSGVKDIALLFIAIGDHEVDDCPLQIGQFESGDEELDLWLTRTYPEGGGGANEGESYGLIHNFAANNIVTDAWEKRGQKGVLIMIGDEPSLDYYPDAVMKEIKGNPQAKGFSQDEILEKVREKWNVFHINPHHSYDQDYWKPKLGQNYISLSDFHKVPETVTQIVTRFANQAPTSTTPEEVAQSRPEDDPTFIR